MPAAITPVNERTILHQEKVEAVIDARAAGRGTDVIDSPTAPGATYSQAEAESAKTAIDEIRAALSAAGITA